MNGIDKLWSFEVEGSKWPNRQDHTLRWFSDAEFNVDHDFAIKLDLV